MSVTQLRARHLQQAIWLEWFTIAYMIFEAVAAIGLGVAAASASLEAFGFDSLIELMSASILLWRLLSEQRNADEERVEQIEQRAARLAGISLMVLAVYIVVESLYSLIASTKPAPTTWGLALAMLSLLVMPALAKLKLQVADKISSRALHADAIESVACAYLSFTLLLGLGANFLFGWWWADSLAALVMVYFIAREAKEALTPEHDEE